MSKALHWNPGWSKSAVRACFPSGKVACGRRVRDVEHMGTSDGDFGCSPEGRCRSCWAAYSRTAMPVGRDA